MIQYLSPHLINIFADISLFILAIVFGVPIVIGLYKIVQITRITKGVK
jgi:hypothetical protein